MKHLSRGAAVAVAAVSLTGVGLAQATATVPDAPASAAHVGSVAAAGTVVVHGSVVDPDGSSLDNVSVEARSVDAPDVVVASDISYGGDYDLNVSVGRYVLEYSDLSGVYAPLTTGAVTVTGDRTVDTVRIRMLFPAPRPLVDPSIGGPVQAGRTLRAVPGTWDVENASFTYEWTVNGAPAAAGGTFPLSSRHVGTRVGLTVTARARGHRAAVVATRAVRVARFASRVAVTGTMVLKDRHVVVGVRVRTPGDLKAGKVVVLEVAGPDNGVLARFPAAATRGSRWDRSFVLPKTRKGVHTYLVTFSGTGKVEPSAARTTVRVR